MKKPGFALGLCLGVAAFSPGTWGEAGGNLDGKIRNLEKRMDQLRSRVQQAGQPVTTTTAAGSSDGRVVAVVNGVIPTVVSIHSERIVEVQPDQFFNPMDEFFYDNPHHRNLDPESRKFKQQGLGSGVIVSTEGHILTNYHVAGEADKINVTLNDDRELEAEVIGSDKLSDVAVIKIKSPPPHLPVAQLGDSDELEVGETVIAIGSPFGYTNTVTSGILSAKGRRVGLSSYENYLQTDASINPGNSGGALVDLEGRLVGINTAIASRSGASHGIGFAIPINMAKAILDDILQDGIVTRGYLGVHLQDIDRNLSGALGLANNQGALVARVIEDSPAARSGFEDGDAILQVNGKDARNVNEVRNMVAMLEPGGRYDFTVFRAGKKMNIKVTVEEREGESEKAESEKTSHQNLGLTLQDIGPELVRRYRLETQTGILVADVEVGSRADKAGFLQGDVILFVQSKAVGSAKEFHRALKKSKKSSVLVAVMRRMNKVYLGLSLK